MVFLCETKCKRDKLENIKNKIGFDFNFIVDYIGRSGGLSIFWKKDLKAELHSYSLNHVSLLVFSKSLNKNWLLTGFYRQPVVSKRRQSWNLLRLLKPAPSIPWLCMEDFNEIVSQDENYGASFRHYK